MRPFLTIALVMDLNGSYNTGVLRGIADFARPHHPWIFRFMDQAHITTQMLRNWQVAGVITSIKDAERADALCALGVPVVNVANIPSRPHLPQVGNDDRAIGAVAAQHFLDRGLRHFAYISLHGDRYFSPRGDGFCATVTDAGYPVLRYEEDRGKATGQTPWLWNADYVPLERNLAALPKPVGIFASTDGCGWQVAERCHQMGLRIPEDVALIGVDNTEPICQVAFPPLSSVALPVEHIGYEAAALLDRLLAGATPPALPHYFMPIGIVTRQSSDMLAVEDQDIARALGFIQRHFADRIRVEEVAAAALINRRTLERKFQVVLGRTLLQEIQRVRLERAKQVLADTNLSIARVAEEAGFNDAKHLALVFQQKLGTTPTAYRRTFHPRTSG